MLRSRRIVTFLAPLAAVSLALAPACADDDDGDDGEIENPVGGGEDDGDEDGGDEDD